MKNPPRRDHKKVVVNIYIFLPGASAPPKHSAASPLTAAATGCVLCPRIGTQQVWNCIGRLAGVVLLSCWVAGDLGLGDKQREIGQI